MVVPGKPILRVARVSESSFFHATISLDCFCRYVRDLKGWSCGDAVYSLPRLRQDFKKMADDGAKLVRIYGPICEQESVWDNIVQAAAENNLSVSSVRASIALGTVLFVVVEYSALFGTVTAMMK